MHGHSEDLLAFFWSALMLTCFSREGPGVKTRLAMEDEIPEIYNTIHQDKCDKFEVIQNFHRPYFILAISKCSDGSSAEKGAIYKFNQSKESFELVELETSGGVSSLDKVIPTGDEMFCISYSKNITFLIDENLKIRRREELVANYEYYPHPDFSDSLIRFPQESKSGVFDGDLWFSHEEYWAPKYRSFHKFDWIFKQRKYACLMDNHIAYVFSSDTGNVNVKAKNVNHYKLSGSHILVIHNTSDKGLNLSIIDIGNSTLHRAYFPLLLKIKDVKFFDYAFGNYYLMLVHEDMIACLWTSTAAGFHFVKKTCFNDSGIGMMESRIHVDKRLEGLIYLNFLTNEHEFKTHKSMDDGRFWNPVKSYELNSGMYQSIEFNFEFHHRNSIPVHFEWIDIQYEKFSDYLQPFMTTDGGDSWFTTPKSASRVIMLNYETVILSIAHDLSAIIYSLDLGNTWLTYKLFPTQSTLLHVGKLSDTDLKVIVITRDPEADDMRFDILDFSNIFKIECQTNHIRQVSLQKSVGFCYRGKRIDKITRDLTIRCTNKLQEHMKVESFCPCSSDDFGCDFNFQPKDDICVLDPLSNIIEQPLACGKGSHFDITQFGYIRLARDSCDPHEMHTYYNVSANIPCVHNELTNFLILSKKSKIYLSEIMLDGGHFIKQNSSELILNKKANLNHPIALDNLQHDLYNYLDKYITRFQIGSPKIQVIYYVNETIKDMTYDPLTHVLIYLTDHHQLKILSLLTHYEHVISESITWFTYSPHHRLISAVMSNNYFCYSELLGALKCIQSLFNLLQSFVDFRNWKVFLLTTEHILIIHSFVKDPSNLHRFLEISDVTDFAVFDDNLYFLVNGQVIYRNLKQNRIDVLLIKNFTFSRLRLHRESFMNYKYCEILKCQYFCQPTLTNEVTCGCPSPMIFFDNKCQCHKDNSNCTVPKCAGFICNNSQCLLDNVRCNGVNDCGDHSDEMNCKTKCSSDTHLCRNKCFIKDAVCGPAEINVIDYVARSKHMRSGYILLIILACLILLSYPLYLLFRWLNKKYGRVRLTLNPYTHPLEPFEYNELFGVENEESDLMLM